MVKKEKIYGGDAGKTAPLNATINQLVGANQYSQLGRLTALRCN